MKILIIGSGGREHALGWKLYQSPKVEKIYFAPGNAGTAMIGKNLSIKAVEINKLLDFTEKNKIGLTVVGPEDPLSLGIVDLFESKGLKIFGPTKSAARLESSKVWSAQFMKKYHIPAPDYYRFTDYRKACLFFDKHEAGQYVIKASGLALGKGVILPRTKPEALAALKRMMVEKEFGAAGEEVIIQERLTGQEVSVLSLTDGKTIVPLLPAQDHKRIYDYDRGPNTGGMGAYAPVPFVDKNLIGQIQKTILAPTIHGMKKEGCLYKGVLYAGLMITKDGPKVLEYNARFGDPETQPLMMLLRSDLLKLFLSVVKGTLEKQKIEFLQEAAVCVVIAAAGYPGKYAKGETIYGLDKKTYPPVFIFQAGAVGQNGQTVVSGGRVLGVTAKGKDLKSAIKNAYSSIGKKGVYFNNMQYRKDIGAKKHDKSY